MLMVDLNERLSLDDLPVDGRQVPAALLHQFLDEAAIAHVDIGDFNAALAPGQASGLLPWVRANDVSFEAVLKALCERLREVAIAAGMFPPGGDGAT